MLSVLVVNDEQQNTLMLGRKKRNKKIEHVYTYECESMGVIKSRSCLMFISKVGEMYVEAAQKTSSLQQSGVGQQEDSCIVTKLEWLVARIYIYKYILYG